LRQPFFVEGGRRRKFHIGIENLFQL
jgi:hypothetical protein